MDFIPYGRQSINDDDIRAVTNVLQSDFLTQGPQVPIFEDLVASSVHSKHAVASNSATSALHTAMLALGVQPGDTVWVPAITFVATANAALYCGANVEFVDIDPHTFNMCIDDLTTRLEVAAKKNALPKVVTVVHMCGTPADLEQLQNLALIYGFRVVEDASHAVGARYRGSEIGNCAYSDITVFSFHPVKIVTSGEGGMATTNDDLLAQRMAKFRSHGITRQFESFTDKTQGSWHYEQHELGFNYRLPELSAALGANQFRKRDGFIEKRRVISQRYREALAHLKFQNLPDGAFSSHHLEVVQVEPTERRALFDHLRGHGVGVNVHYAPVFSHPYYKSLRADWGQFPNSISYFESSLSLPIFPNLSESNQLRVVELIEGHRGSQVIF